PSYIYSLSLHDALPICLLIRRIINQTPNRVIHGELIILIANPWKNAHFKTTHREQKVRVVSAVDTSKRLFPFNCRDRSRETLLKDRKSTRLNSSHVKIS